MTASIRKTRTITKTHSCARDAFNHAQAEHQAGRRVQLGRPPMGDWTTISTVTLELLVWATTSSRQ